MDAYEMVNTLTGEITTEQDYLQKLRQAATKRQNHKYPTQHFAKTSTKYMRLKKDWPAYQCKLMDYIGSQMGLSNLIVFSVSKASRELDMSRNTVSKYLNILITAGYLRPTDTGVDKMLMVDPSLMTKVNDEKKAILMTRWSKLTRPPITDKQRQLLIKEQTAIRKKVKKLKKRWDEISLMLDNAGTSLPAQNEIEHHTQSKDEHTVQFVIEQDAQKDYEPPAQN